MNRRVRIAAEMRVLFWPWLGIVVSSVLAAQPESKTSLSLLSSAGNLCLFAGIPLLATLVFGYEFQNGTLPLLLSQPIERSKIWVEKSIVMGAAVLSVGIVYGITAVRSGFPKEFVFLACLWFFITAGSAVYWTLVARSIIGGLVLNGLQLVALLISLDWRGWLGGKPFTNLRLPIIVAVLSLVYVTLMLYLGRRKLLSFEMSGAGSGSNLVSSDSAMRIRFVSELLRCRSDQAFLNLIRKETHLLWPLFMLTLGVVAILAGGAAVSFVSGHAAWTPTMGVVAVILHAVMTGILAGSLPLGEERISGTHSWNMTLPVSIRRQWAIKILLALASSCACSAIVIGTSMLTGPSIVREMHTLFEGESLAPLTVLVPLTLIAFWCSTAIRGTVRAAFWSVPIALVLTFTFRTGVALKLHGVIDVLVSALHPFPFTKSATRFLFTPSYHKVIEICFEAALLSLVAWQSFKMFRTEVRESIAPLIRRLIPLLAVALVFGFTEYAPQSFVIIASYDRTNEALKDIARAVMATSPDQEKLKGAGSVELSLTELTKMSSLSQRTLAWVEDGPVTVQAGRGTYEIRKGAQSVRKPYHYSITANLHDGWKCRFRDNVLDMNGLFDCKSAAGSPGFGLIPVRSDVVPKKP